MRELEYRLVRLVRRNRDGSKATQADRRRMASLFARTLHERGYRIPTERSVKPKHIVAAVEAWKGAASDATLKNRLAFLRWLAEKIDKPNIVPRTNAELGVGKRAYRTNVSKAINGAEAKIARVNDRHVKISLQLQQHFGLRREEAMKLQPAWADRGDRLRLKSSWCKGGREREIPIRTPEQRSVLDEAKGLAGNDSMIPCHKSYREHLAKWQYETTRAGISRTHGLRHAYAQRRYLELTGWKPPAAGGPLRAVLTDQQREADFRARMQISGELGHCRVDVVALYCGR